MAVETELGSAKDRRRERAQDYLETDLAKQRQWYSARASKHKAYAQRMGLAVIAGGGLVTFVAAIKPLEPGVATIILAALGFLIALVQGIMRIWRYDETWVEYRKASERMKREQRLYVNACGPYADGADEEARFKAFVMAIEQVIAEEQQIYFASTAAPKEGEQKKAP